MADVPVLVCTTGELAGQRIPVPEGGIAIGRSSDNAVVLSDEGVSRYHGRLLFENGSLWLQDAGSRNGVFVNGVRVTGHRALQVGDSITIAEHTFELRWQEEHEVDAPAPVRPRPRHDNVTPSGSPTAEPAPRRRWYWPFS